MILVKKIVNQNAKISFVTEPRELVEEIVTFTINTDDAIKKYYYLNDNTNETFDLIMADNVNVGFIGYKKENDDFTNFSICIKEEFRNNGIGKKTIESLKTRENFNTNLFVKVLKSDVKVNNLLNGIKKVNFETDKFNIYVIPSKKKDNKRRLK